MKGRKALLTPFRYYLNKYVFFLLFSSAFIALISFFASIETNMAQASHNHYKSTISGDLRIDPSCIYSSSLLKSIISECGEENGIEITDFHYLYPTVYTYIECSNGKREYLSIQPRGDLEKNEVLLPEETAADGTTVIYDPHTSSGYEVVIPADEKRNREEYIGIHEALVSEYLYWKIAASQGIERDNCFLKAVISYDGELNADSFFRSYISRETELINTGKLKRSLTSTQLYLNKNGSRTFQTKYSYNYISKSFSSGEKISLLSAHYNTDLVNEIDRLNGPKIFLIRYGVLLITSICISLIFTELSILKSREKEFSLNSTLGMKKPVQIKILFEEKLIIFIFLVLSTLVLTFLLSLIPVFYSPEGARLVFGEDLYMRDLYSLDGTYSTSGIFLYAAVLLAIFFAVIYVLTFFVDLIFLNTLRRKKRI